MDHIGFTNLARGLDPALIMHDLSLIPDPWQARLLRSRSPRILLLCSRQLGKSTATACLALHQACYVPGSLVLLVSRSERQAAELFAKVAAFYRVLRPVEATKELALGLELANGSRIITLPGDPAGLRSYSAPDLVVVDEAALVHEGVLAAVLPMLLVSGGRLVALSTPHGRRGFFWDRWQSDDPTWERIDAKACDSPRISPEALAEQRASLGDRLYRQEFENAFLEFEDAVFSAESIARLFVDDGPDAGLPVWQDFWLGLDLGSLADYAALVVLRRWHALDRYTREPEQDSRGQPRYRWDILRIKRWPLKTPYVEVVADVTAMVRRSELPCWPTLAIDASGVGTPVTELVREGLAGHPQCQVWACAITGTIAGLGWRLAAWRHLHVGKSELVGGLRAALERGSLKVATDDAGNPVAGSDVLRRELADFQVRLTPAGGETTGAIGSAHDDVVMALALPLFVGSLRVCHMIEFATAGGEPTSLLQVRHRFKGKAAVADASRNGFVELPANASKVVPNPTHRLHDPALWW
jgi:hypothetical protein